MISRIVDCNVKPDKLNALRSKLNTDYLPRIKQQPGFVDVIESVDTETGHVKITKLINVIDCGTPINPKLVETQISGAALMHRSRIEPVFEQQQ